MKRTVLSLFIACCCLFGATAQTADYNVVPLPQEIRMENGAGFVLSGNTVIAYNGDKIGQGRENAKNFLQENPDIMYEIEQKVRMAYGLPSDLAEEMESAAGETEE
jgi:hypothetical protein